MSKVKAEMASKAQQSCVGTDSTKPRGGGLATAVGPVRRIGPGATPAGCMGPSFTVAFIGESVTRAVSLRKPVWAALRFPTGLLIGGNTGFSGTGASGAGGSGVFNPADEGGAGGRASGEGGRTGAGEGGGKSAAGASASVGRGGGRFGKMMRADSVSTGNLGGGVLCGGKLMRTVSFFGSFRSAIT